MFIDINTATRLLHEEKVVGVPTETVYGLAARYDSNTAIKTIFELKKRPLDHPLIVHINTLEWLNRLTKEYPSYVSKLIEAFWPGPLTLVLIKNEKISPLITAGQQTVAVRMPSHPTCLALISNLNKPIVAPSANPYCRISPTSPEHVLKYFSHTVPVINSGPSDLGIESTIILATNKNHIQILRHGAVTQEAIEIAAQIKCVDIDRSIKAPGNKHKHYSPTVPLIPFDHKNEIKKYIDNKNSTYFFILLNKFSTGKHHAKHVENNPKNYAAKLYELWHEAEDGKYDAIFIERPRRHSDWQAILDRINKASDSY